MPPSAAREHPPTLEVDERFVPGTSRSSPPTNVSVDVVSNRSPDTTLDDFVRCFCRDHMPAGWQSTTGWHDQAAEESRAVGRWQIAMGKQLAPAVH
jgi:hypothetical protein